MNDINVQNTDDPQTVKILENLSSTLAATAQNRGPTNSAEVHESSANNSRSNNNNTGVKAAIAQLLQQQGIRVNGKFDIR